MWKTTRLHNYLFIFSLIGCINSFPSDDYENGNFSFDINLPIQICTDDGKAYERQIKKSLSIWEKAIDMDLFNYTSFPCSNPIRGASVKELEKRDESGLQDCELEWECFKAGWNTWDYELNVTTGIVMNLYPEDGRFDNVLLHEMGHLLGLMHSDNPDSIMFYKNISQNDLSIDRETIHKVRDQFSSLHVGL